MSKFIKIWFDKYVPVSLQQPLKRLFIWPLWHIINYFKDIWLPIYRIDRAGLSVILIGHEACDPFSDKVDPYLINLLFAEYVEPIKIGVMPIWSLSRVIRRWKDKTDFIIFRHRRFRPRATVARRMLMMPYHVAQIADLPRSDADLLAAFHTSTTRNDLKKIQYAGFQYEVTQDPAQVELFYHQMYQPYIQDRHRESAQCIPWDDFKRIFDNTELLLVRKAGVPVAGNLFLQISDSYNSHAFGVLNADRELLKAGALAACYWFSIVEAQRRGCSVLNMQCARPFLKDGVLIYKKKWRSRIVADHVDREFWFLPCGKRPAMYRFLEENPFICEQDGRLVSLIFLGSNAILNDKDLSSYLRSCHYQGDHLSTCVVLLNSEWLARLEVIQNILRELPQPNHILDLSHGSLAELPKMISKRQSLSVLPLTEFPELVYSR